MADLPPAPKTIVLTGGPGGGKTAALEVVRRTFGDCVEVLPEAATIVFGGGFPRRPTPPARRAAQRAIFRIQCELERLAHEESVADLLVCDRGTVDAAAYWPDPSESLWSDVASSLERELARYTAVLHLRPPPVGTPGCATNPMRIETPAEALAIDARIERVWSGHPRRFIIESTPSLLDKIARVLELVRAEMPPHAPPFAASSLTNAFT